MSLTLLLEQRGDSQADSAIILIGGHNWFVAGRLLDLGHNNCYVFPMFIRRLGPDPHANGQMSRGLCGCPDILEMDNGDFAIIGEDITGKVAGRFAFGASCGPDERIVRIPRQTLLLAKRDIPDSQ